MIDNSGFSGVALEVFLIRKQITVSNLFSATFSLIGDLFVLLHYCMLN